MTLLGVVTIEVHVFGKGVYARYFICFFLGVSIDAFDRISFGVGHIITTGTSALVFVRGLFLAVISCF